VEDPVRVVVFGLVLAAAAQGCSCLPPASCRSLWEAAVVFTGKAVRTGPEGGATVAVAFEMSEALRGALTARVEVRTAAADAMCGYPFQMGREYLVYAQQEDGRLVTGLCSGTKPLADAAGDLRYLRRAGRLPSNLSPRPSYVFGRVSRQGRWPIRGAVVVAHRENGVEDRTVTGDDGQFDFYDLPSGHYEISGVGTERKRVQLQAGACAEVLLVNTAVAELRGRLFEADGEQAATGELRLTQCDGTEELTTETARDGTFQFQAPPGRYFLVGKARGASTPVYYPGVPTREEATPIDLTVDGRVKGVWFHLPAGTAQTLRGAVLDAQGAAVREAIVRVSGETRGGSTATGARGEFSIEMPPGAFEIWAEAKACPGVRSLKLRVGPGHSESVSLRLPLGKGGGCP
jgi:hypothetical protein